MAMRNLGRAYEWFCSAMAFRREMRDLRKLTDRELKDIGINRTDVEALARGLCVTKGT